MKNKKKHGAGMMLILLAVAIAIGWWVYRALPRLNVDSAGKMGMTPTQIQSIRDIGQWEFLSVSDEELVDTTRRGIFIDDHLVRIYYGTMRLGIDMSLLTDESVDVVGDSVRLTLPPITLLDDNFIDEALTKAFHESGRWSADDREALYRKAQRQMITHGLSPENITIAQNNADAQLRTLLRAMGFKKVILRFRTPTPR